MRAIRELKSYLSDGILQDIVAAHLYATSVIDNDEEILVISVGEVNSEGKRPLTCRTIKNKEVELIVHS